MDIDTTPRILLRKEGPRFNDQDGDAEDAERSTFSERDAARCLLILRVSPLKALVLSRWSMYGLRDDAVVFSNRSNASLTLDGVVN